jgi:Flp pilus assembly protein TadB
MLKRKKRSREARDLEKRFKDIEKRRRKREARERKEREKREKEMRKIEGKRRKEREKRERRARKEHEKREKEERKRRREKEHHLRKEREEREKVENNRRREREHHLRELRGEREERERKEKKKRNEERREEEHERREERLKKEEREWKEEKKEREEREKELLKKEEEEREEREKRNKKKRKEKEKKKEGKSILKHKRMARLYPMRYRRHMNRLFLYSGYEGREEAVLSAQNISAIVVLIAFVALYFVLGLSYLLIFAPIGMALVYFGFYFMVYFKMVGRTSNVEKYLPDVLQLVAANVRSGMTPFQALKFSAREEFGELKTEIEHATTKALGTESFSDALSKISGRINSLMLDRVMKLFVSSLRSGGQMAKILQEMAKDISETRALRRELVTNTKTYSMFIFFVVLAGTPFLLVISIRFLEMITAIQSNVGDVGFGMGFLMGDITISPAFLMVVSVVMLLVTSLSAASLMGVIKEGKIKYGFKYFPMLAILTLIAFFAIDYLIDFVGLF